MTPQEAIEIIKIAKAEVEWEHPIDYAAAFDMAIEALERQKPKKIAEFHSGNYCICPNCQRLILRHRETHGNINISFCEWCGQALEWNKEDNYDEL